MDDLFKIWQSRKDENDLPPIDEKQLLLKSNSLNPLRKLKLNFAANLIFACCITLFFMFLFFYLDGFWVRVSIGILLTGYLAAIAQTYYIYRKYLMQIHPDDNVYHYIQKLYVGISKAMRIQELVALVYYPIAMVSGFLISLYMNDKMNVIQENTTILYILVVAIIIFTPICYFIAKWLNKIAFGNALKKLKVLTDEMNSE